MSSYRMGLNDIETTQKSIKDYLFPLIDIDNVDPVHTGLEKVDDETGMKERMEKRDMSTLIMPDLNYNHKIYEYSEKRMYEMGN